jgi:hypothetical protein
MAGDTIDPCVSVPMPKATQPPAVADDGPADEPLEPCVRFHGLFVRPPNHWSFCANSPVVNFAINTAPASRRRTTTSASSSMMRSLKSAAPHVVGTPLVSKRSFTPYGIPCSGPRYLPAAISASAFAASANPCDSMIVTAQFSVGLSRFKPLEVDRRQPRRCDLLRLDERGQPMRGQKRDRLV